MIKEMEDSQKFNNLKIEEITPSKIWNKLTKTTTFKHDPLTDKEKLIAIDIRLNKTKEYDVPAFITGLKSEYSKDEIEGFMLDILELDCIVDSIKTRSIKEDGEKIYDVLLWVNENNFMRLLMWNDVFSEILFRDLCDHEFSHSIKDFLFFLPTGLLEKGKTLIEHSLRNKSDLNSVEKILEFYCDDPEGLLEELGQIKHTA